MLYTIYYIPYAIYTILLVKNNLLCIRIHVSYMVSSSLLLSPLRGVRACHAEAQDGHDDEAFVLEGSPRLG